MPDVGSLPEPVAHVVEHGYGTAIGEIFLVAAPLGLLVVLPHALPSGEAARAAQRDRARGARPAPPPRLALRGAGGGA